MEKKLTTYFWVIILITLTVVAFFLASGTNELAAGVLIRLFPPPETEVRGDFDEIRSPQAGRRTGLDSSIILKRNIFDSTPPEPPVPDVEEDVPLDEGELPLVQCTMGDVKLLAMVSSPRETDWSFANLQVGAEQILVRAGDSVRDRVVSDIGWRYLLLRGQRDECYIDMFDQDPRRVPPRPQTTAAARPMADTITATGEFERTVARSVVDQALANPASFAKDVRVRPFRRDGEVVGFRLRQVQKGSAIEQLGARRGDVLHSVNGIDLKTVDDALTAYQRLRTDNQLTFSVTRAGKPVDLRINIE